MTPSRPRPESLVEHLRALQCSTAARVAQDLLATATREDWSPERFARELCAHELEGRRQRRITRLAKAAHLPPGKTLATLEQDRLPLRIRRQVTALCTGEFVDEALNVLIFGLPGRGKTHVAAAVGAALVQLGRQVLFTPTFQLVDLLLRAKRDLQLERQLRRLDRFEVLILDDLGYVQQNRDEMEVLFTLLADRYERRSVMITSNLVFSQWDRIFKDPMTTAAAIDRVVHHSLIIEFGKDTRSVRAEQAKQRQHEREAASA